MGTLRRQHLPEEHLESIELAPLSNPHDSCASEERGLRKALAAAETRWAKAVQGANFEESRQAQKPEPKFRRQPPAEYSHGSSLR